MALTATADSDSFAAFPPRAASRAVRTRFRRTAAGALLGAVLALGLAPTAADAGETRLTAIQTAAVAPDHADGRGVTIVLRSPNRIVEGERVTLQSAVRFSGRAWDEARIEILANGIVVARTIALRGGVWYAPRTKIPAGDYEFTARAISPDGKREVSEVLRVTVSPPILLDPETLAGKSVYTVGSLAPAAPTATARTG